MENSNINLLNTQENKGLQSLHVEHVSDKKFVWMDVYDITDVNDIMSFLTIRQKVAWTSCSKSYLGFKLHRK